MAIYRATLVIDVTIKDDNDPRLKQKIVKQVHKTLLRQADFIKTSNVLEIFRPVKEQTDATTNPPRDNSQS